MPISKEGLPASLADDEITNNQQEFAQSRQNPEVKAKKSNWIRRAALGSLMLGAALCMRGDERMPDEVLLTHDESLVTIDDTLTVMTANVHGWSGGDGNNFDKFKQVYNDQDVDIACLQEVLADGPELMELYRQGNSVYFDTTIRYPMRGRFGNAIVTPAPLKQVSTIELPNPKTYIPRNAVTAVIQTKNRPISITNMHLSTHDQESRVQSEHLYPYIGQKADIVCGDFNQPPKTVRSSSLGVISTGSFFAARAATYPAESPRIEIDHIFSSCGHPIKEQGTQIDFGSDHLAKLEAIDTSDC